MAKEFVKHAKMQEHIVNIEQHQENDLKLDEFYIGGNEDHLFSLKNVQFNFKLFLQQHKYKLIITNTMSDSIFTNQTLSFVL